MRGKAVSSLVSSMLSRITPAYAGKSSVFLGSSFSKRDHPRLCGEKFLRLPALFSVPGSPPPMRGKVIDSNYNMVALRITPAYAGKSEHTGKHERGVKDHPRLCGEKR